MNLPYSQLTLPALLVFALFACDGSVTETPAEDIVVAPQPIQPPQNCQPCHERQYRESLSSVMSGYRSVSPLMNALELGGNFLVQGVLESGAIGTNLRPQYETPSEPGLSTGTNSVSATEIVTRDQARSAFCIGCHNPGLVLDGEDPDKREIPEWQGRYGDADPACVATGTVACFRPIENVRPLRDYHLVGSDGRQVLPATPGGAPPPGATPSLGAHAIHCDICHNARAPDLLKSLQRDGFGNGAFKLEPGRFKVGPFDDAVVVGPLESAGESRAFHFNSRKPAEIAYIRSSEFCISCHDVRIPAPSLFAPEGTPEYFRLENLGTEWATQAYAGNDNPFGAIVRCQDCHMSMYPYGGDSTYTIADPADPTVQYTITSPTPSVFPTNKAAGGTIDPTGAGLPLPDRKVVTHQFTGVDVPMLSDAELRARLGPDRPDTDAPGVDEHGIPNSLVTRREDLLKAGLRLYLDRTDARATLGSKFNVRVTALALTGHNWPSGFSQERTTWIDLRVTAKRRGSNEDFVLYQSGYQVDKPHPETGEMVADGSLHDEDLEHATVVVNPFTHDNEVFESGPDAGPLERAFEGEATGLVLFRNELIRVYGPGAIGGRGTGIPATNRLHPRTGAVLSHVLEEETFSAGSANGVDNWRGLPALTPKTYRYQVELPTRTELADLGVELEGDLMVRAAVHFQHFPPLFMRFLARVSGAVPYQLPQEALRVPGFDDTRPGYSGYVGRRGPADRDLQLVDEKRIDDFLRTVRDIAVAERTVPLGG